MFGLFYRGINTWVGMMGAGLRVSLTLSVVEMTRRQLRKEEQLLTVLGVSSGSDGCGTPFSFPDMAFLWTKAN